LHKEELRDLYSSPSVIPVTKSRRIKWVGHVARMGENKSVYRVLVGYLRERGLFEDIGVGGKIILKCIFKK